MAEELQITLAKASDQDLESVKNFFDGLRKRLDDQTCTDLDVWFFIRNNIPSEGAVDRLLLGYSTLVENFCDPDKTYLAPKPEPESDEPRSQ